MKKIARWAAGIFAALAWSAPAAAASYEIFGWELNPYIGGAFGRSTAGGDCGPGGTADGDETDRTGLTLAVSYQGASECGGADTGFKLYGGIRVYEYLALEAGYLSLGIHSRVIAGTAVGEDMIVTRGSANVEVEHDGGWMGSVVGMLPLARIVPRTILPSGEVIALGRLGMHSWDVVASSPPGGVDYAQAGAADNPRRHNDVSFAHARADGGVDPFFGAGAEYLLDNGVGLRLEWERYLFAGDWREADVDLISLGAVYRF